ncbi:unnamed protein product [Pylaiella littoralis]
MVGRFAFFLAEGSPFLVFKAKEVEEREGEMGFVGQWWTPANSSLRAAADTVPFEDYCNTRVTFTSDYVMKPSVYGGRPTRAPDLGWERVDRVVVWFKNKELNGKGKKFPKIAVDAVSLAFQQRQKEREEEQPRDEGREDESREGEPQIERAG